MNLYRIILVDDEEEVRKSIIKQINWTDAGFLVAGDAENGEDALEKIELLEPDVVLTDIRMPYMDGLQLAEKVRQRFPSTKVVIFSGYDDFEYAQRAIKLNVSEYILKPVNVEELTVILKKIKGNLDEEIEQKRNVSRLRENYRNSLPILREHFLNDMVRGRMDEGTLEQKMREYDIPLQHAEKWIAAVVSIEPDKNEADTALSFHKEQELIPISVRELLEEKLRTYCRFAMFSATSEMVIIAAIDGDHYQLGEAIGMTQTQTGYIDLLGDICKEARRVLEVSITIGVGSSVENLMDIHQSFKLAVNALGYQSIVGSGSTIYINDVEPVNRGKLQFESQDEAALVSAIKFGPQEKITSAIMNIVGKMDDAKVHMRQYQAYVLSIVNSLTQMMQQYDLDINQTLGSETEYVEMLTATRKREDFAKWLIEVGCRINDSVKEERDSATKQVIEQAKQYIQDHYQNPDLSVEMICRQLHMSPAYFSTMFKKETGQAYIAYLTEVRLLKAVELLNKTDDKTYVIAAKVGYQEQNYFSYVFKKKYGVSPSRFRGQR